MIGTSTAGRLVANFYDLSDEALNAIAADCTYEIQERQRHRIRQQKAEQEASE
jgi:hypothetical protein